MPCGTRLNRQAAKPQRNAKKSCNSHPRIYATKVCVIRDDGGRDENPLLAPPRLGGKSILWQGCRPDFRQTTSGCGRIPGGPVLASATVAPLRRSGDGWTRVPPGLHPVVAGRRSVEARSASLRPESG